jgi:hypothetical protein
MVKPPALACRIKHKARRIMGSFKPTGGKLVRRFSAEDSDGNIYFLVEYELTIRSGEIHRDGMSRKGQLRRYFELEDGTSVNAHETEPHAFKIVGSNKIIREIID